MQSLIPTILGLGLAIALCSPVSVVTVIVLLSMPAGRRRAIAFLLGWLFAIGVIAVVVLVFAHGQDFSSHKTTPSRAASWVEIAAGLLLVLGASRSLLRHPQRASRATPPKWLDRLDRTNWVLAVPLGAFMLTYSLTAAAAIEILKAHVSITDDVLAFVIFGVASVVTIAAPIVLVVVAPERSAQRLEAWRRWLLGNSRTIGLVALIVIGALVIAKGAHDLIV